MDQKQQNGSKSGRAAGIAGPESDFRESVRLFGKRLVSESAVARMPALIGIEGALLIS